MICDAKRLSRAMTMKNAAAGLALGGGKAVLLDDGRWDGLRRERLLAFAEFLNGLGGRYITAEDSGTSADDMALIATVSQYVAGKPAEAGGRGDPSPYTARTVLAAIEAAVMVRLGGRKMNGVRVGILGAGAVGSRLAELLVECDAEVVIADIVPDRAAAVVAATGASTCDPESLLTERIDVFAPCGLGGVIDASVAANLRCPIVAGAANNPLADEVLAQNLHDAGILYVPDFIANCGGIIHVGAEALSLSSRQAEDLTAAAVVRAAGVLSIAAERDVPPLDVANELAVERLATRPVLETA